MSQDRIVQYSGGRTITLYSEDEFRKDLVIVVTETQYNKEYTKQISLPSQTISLTIPEARSVLIALQKMLF